MKFKFIISIYLLFTTFCQAKYTPLMLSQLIDSSNFIGIGVITKVEPHQIFVEFSDAIKGNLKTKIIRINQFENWTCASRWTNYKTGQKELFFLIFSKNGDFDILGSGNEGEMPIKDNKIYYKSPYGIFDKYSKKYTIYNGELYGYLFTVLEVKNGILEYLSQKSKYHTIAKEKSKKLTQIKNQFLKKLVFELKTEIYFTE